LDDERGNLALEFCRLTDQLAPSWVVWENVPGVLSSGGGRDFGSIVGAMVELGYNVAWRILDAQNFGVPQRRRRIFLIGHLGANERGAAAVLFERESLRGDIKKGREAREELAPSVTSGAPFSRTGNERVEAQALVPFTPSSHGSYREGCRTLRSNGGDLGGGSETLAIWRGGDQANAETLENKAGTLNCNKGQQGDNAALPCGEVVGTVTARKGRNNGIANDDVQAGHLICVNARETPVSSSGKDLPLGAQDRGHAVAFAQNTRDEVRLIAGDGSIAGALAANPGMKQQTYVFEPGNLKRRCGSEPNETTAPTLGADKLGDTFPHIATEMQVRRLTPKECERLQGMPDDHTKIPWRKKEADDCPDGPRYKAIGNSMAVPVMKWIGERIAMVEDILNGNE
jgi:DNA (cytosine-5)-methyltransferase 1